MVIQLFEKARRQGVQEAVSAFAAHAPFSRRVWAVSYSVILALEGLGWLFGGTIVLARKTSASPLMRSTLDYGPLNIFTAALLATDSSAMHLHTSLFYFARAIKLLYPLYSASISIALLLVRAPVCTDYVWTLARLTVTVLWIYYCMKDLNQWNIDKLPLPSIPGIEFRESSESGSSDTERSRSSRDDLESEQSEDEWNALIRGELAK